MRLRRRV